MISIYIIKKLVLSLFLLYSAEVFRGVMLEAMSAGRPVIGTNVGWNLGNY